MHGLAEIRETNRRPHAPRKDAAMFAGRHRDDNRDRAATAAPKKRVKPASARRRAH